MNIYRDINVENYIIAKYFLNSRTNLADAAFEVATGQSCDNPFKRSVLSTDELLEEHSCKILAKEEILTKKKHGHVSIAFPLANLSFVEDGLSHLLCQLMGGQVDINNIISCRLLDITLPKEILKYKFKPKYGIDGFREYTGVKNKPFFGSIIKPKVGLRVDQLLEIVKQLVDGGVNFIKEDEILGQTTYCDILKRTYTITDYLRKNNHKVIYAVCINSDNAREKAWKVAYSQGNGIHLNIWSGLGEFYEVRKMDYNLFFHFQKSGDRVITDKRNPFSISWDVICKLAAFCGVDSIHAGMWGGYASQSEKELKTTLGILQRENVIPALSCGMNKELIKPICDKFGTNWMANVGGAIHSSEKGVYAATKEIREVIDGI